MHHTLRYTLNSLHWPVLNGHSQKVSVSLLFAQECLTHGDRLHPSANRLKNPVTGCQPRFRVPSDRCRSSTSSVLVDPLHGLADVTPFALFAQEVQVFGVRSEGRRLCFERYSYQLMCLIIEERDSQARMSSEDGSHAVWLKTRAMAIDWYSKKLNVLVFTERPRNASVGSGM